MIITPIIDELIPELEVFCKKAKELKYENNSSLKAMKFDWCKEHGEYFCAIKGNDIVAVAGCHPLPEVASDAWRIMFRGCELPQTDTFKGLGKGNWNSITQREMIPKFIDWCPSNQLFLTTNIDHEHSNGKASRNHRLMGLLAKQKILDKYGDIELYYTAQTVWKLNIQEYTRRRNRLRGIYVL
tara:strand:+ start:448 stop:999 length:552 start_codon:yes stop_codon:yes gene_type:complete